MAVLVIRGRLLKCVPLMQKRDLKAIMHKCVHVLLPVRSNKALLHDCEC